MPYSLDTPGAHGPVSAHPEQGRTDPGALRFHAARHPLVRVLHDQDRVLRHQPDQHDEPDLRVDVEALAEEEERDERPEDRERDREEDRERVNETFELGGEHEEDEDHGEHEEEVEFSARLAELPRLAAQIALDAARQLGRGDAVQIGQRLSQTGAGGQVRAQRGRANAVEVVELLGRHGLTHPHHVGQLHQPAGAAQVDALDGVGTGALIGLHLGDHVVLLGAALEVRSRAARSGR